jgi:RimJ/RimL family protein N-acetyltransferase
VSPRIDADQYGRGRDDADARIVADGTVAGYIGSWQESGQQMLGYWIGREHWGRGVATQGLSLLVDEVSVRPLYAHVVAHNLGSIRVLDKCGFRRDRAQEAQGHPSSDPVGDGQEWLPRRRRTTRRRSVGEATTS